MTSDFLAIPTMEGELVVELYTSRAPRACAYLQSLLSHPTIAPSLRFSERDGCRAVVTLGSGAVGEDAASSGGEFAPGQYFFDDGLVAGASALSFSGAGIVGVPIEPSLKTCAFFVTLRPASEQLDAGCVVVGRVARGMAAVVGAILRARTEGSDERQQRFVRPLEILRAARKFVDATPPRPVLMMAPQQQQQQQQQRQVPVAPAAGTKKSSLLDSLIGDDDDDE